MGQEKLLIRQENFGYLLYSIPMKCYYTVKNNGEFIVSTVLNNLRNGKDVFEQIDAQYLSELKKVGFDNNIRVLDHRNKVVFYSDNLENIDPHTHYLSIWPIDLMKIDQRGGNLFLREHIINNNIMELNKENLVDCIKMWIDQGLYIIANIDSTKISKTRYFGRKPFCHSAFIFGYNEIGIYQVDFLNSGQLDIINVPYEELIEAFFSPELPNIFRTEKNMEVDYNITLIQLRDNIKCDLNGEVIKFWIEEYLQARTIQTHNNFFVQYENTVSGTKIYDCMIKMVKKMKEDNELDYRMFHALYEHKSIMVKRVEELMNQGLISSDEVLVSEAEEIEKISDICRMMVLKYNILPRDDMLEELERNLLELKDKEIIFLTKLRDKL